MRRLGRKILILVMTTFAWIVIAFCIHLSPARGEEPAGDDPQAKAKAFLDQGEFEEAMKAYSDLFRDNPENPDINFNLGRAAFEKGDYETAIMAFERVLIERPDTPRARLELARSYFSLGSFEMAEQYFKEVLAVNPPEAVQSNIARYLQVIKNTRKEHFFSGKIYLGMDADDNVNAAPTSPDIGITTSLGDIIMSVDRPEKDQITTSMANLNYVYRPMDSLVSWKISGMNYNAAYRDSKDLDVNMFDIKAGTSVGRERVAWDIYGLATRLNLDYERYLQTCGAGTGISFAASPSILLSMDGRFRKKNYYDDDTKDAENLSLTFSPIIAIGISRLSMTLGWENETADEDVNTFTRLNGAVSYEIRLPFATTAYVSYWYQDTGYKAVYPLFGKKRNDDVQYVTTGLTKSLKLWKSVPENLDVNLTLNYTYTRSDSSIDLYKYTKNVLSAGMSVTF